MPKTCFDPFTWVGRAVLGPPRLPTRASWFTHDGAHGVTRPTCPKVAKDCFSLNSEASLCGKWEVQRAALYPSTSAASATESNQVRRGALPHSVRPPGRGHRSAMPLPATGASLCGKWEVQRCCARRLGRRRSAPSPNPFRRSGVRARGPRPIKLDFWDGFLRAPHGRGTWSPVSGLTVWSGAPPR